MVSFQRIVFLCLALVPRYVGIAYSHELPFEADISQNL